MTARWALAVFLLGPVFPFVMHLCGWSIYSRDAPLDPVVAVGLTAEFVALALGFLGRRHRSGRIAMIGASIIFSCAVLIPVLS